MFHVFAGCDYYAGGGMADYCCSRPTIEAAIEAAQIALADEQGPDSNDWAHVADDQMRVVWGRCSGFGSVEPLRVKPGPE